MDLLKKISKELLQLLLETVRQGAFAAQNTKSIKMHKETVGSESEPGSAKLLRVMLTENGCTLTVMYP